MSGRHDDSLLLDDILDAASRLVELANTSSTGVLGTDRAINDQILWNLTVLGEATKRLSAASRARFDAIPWQDMAETRDRVVHHYEGVDWETVTSILTDDLPSLLPRLRQARNQLRAEFDA